MYRNYVLKALLYVLGDVTIVHGKLLFEDDGDRTGTFYRTQPLALRPSTITAIPNYAWDNRQPGEMRVWLREGER